MVQMSYFLGNIQKRVKGILTYTLDPLKLCSLGGEGLVTTIFDQTSVCVRVGTFKSRLITYGPNELFSW